MEPTCAHELRVLSFQLSVNSTGKSKFTKN